MSSNSHPIEVKMKETSLEKWEREAKARGFGEPPINTKSSNPNGGAQQIPEAYKEIFELTPTQSGLLLAINNEIKKMTSYGVRLVGVKSIPAWELMWSNAGARWYVGEAPPPVDPRYTKTEWGTYELLRRPLRRSDEVSLDANELLVYGNKEDIQKVLKFLIPLPLYAYSFEAKQRGLYPPNLPPPPATGHWLWEEMPDWLKKLYEEW